MLKAEPKENVSPALSLNTVFNLRSPLLARILVLLSLHRHLAVMSADHLSTVEKKMRLCVILRET